jgi:hypothetical protein
MAKLVEDLELNPNRKGGYSLFERSFTLTRVVRSLRQIISEQRRDANDR